MKLKDILNEINIKYNDSGAAKLSRDSDSYGYETRMKKNLLKVVNKLQGVGTVYMDIVSAWRHGNDKIRVGFIKDGVDYDIILEFDKGVKIWIYRDKEEQTSKMSIDQINQLVNKMFGNSKPYEWKNPEKSFPAVLNHILSKEIQ